MDEILLDTGASFGPVIAIGDPHDPIPPLGAARIFVREGRKEWQDVVRDLLVAARAVVICPTITQGVAWEIGQVLEGRRLPRTVILANPSMPREETLALFEGILLGSGEQGFRARLQPDRQPVAAFLDPADGWTVLAACMLSVQTYTVAMNRALAEPASERRRAEFPIVDAPSPGRPLSGRQIGARSGLGASAFRASNRRKIRARGAMA